MDEKDLKKEPRTEDAADGETFRTSESSSQQEQPNSTNRVVVEVSGGSGSKNGKAIAGLVLGILSLVFLLIFPYISPILAIVGIVLSIQARKALEATPEAGRGMATAGMVCSIVALVLSVIVVACTICVIGMAGASLTDLSNGINSL